MPGHLVIGEPLDITVINLDLVACISFAIQTAISFFKVLMH